VVGQRWVIVNNHSLEPKRIVVLAALKHAREEGVDAACWT
jgi:hypothetical protein